MSLSRDHVDADCCDLPLPEVFVLAASYVCFEIKISYFSHCSPVIEKARTGPKETRGCEIVWGYNYLGEV